MMEDRADGQVVLIHRERLLYLPPLVVGADDELGAVATWSSRLAGVDLKPG